MVVNPSTLTGIDLLRYQMRLANLIHIPRISALHSPVTFESPVANVVAIYGAPGTGGALTSATLTSSGHPFVFVPVSTWVLPRSVWFYHAHATPNGRVLIGTIPRTGYKTCSYLEFDPATFAFRSVQVESSAHETTVIKPGIDVGGADVSHMTPVVVDGDPGMMMQTFWTEQDWDTSIHGRFRNLLLLVEDVDGHWVPDYTHAWTPDDLRTLDPVNGATAFSTQTDGFGHSIAANAGLNESDTLPVSGHVCVAHYFGHGGTGFYGGAVSVFDPETGVQTAYFSLPATMTLADGVTAVGLSPRTVIADPSSSVNDERFVVFSDFFSSVGVPHVPPFFEMKYNAGAGTLVPVSGTILPQYTNSAAGAGRFTDDGHLLVGANDPSGFGFSAKPTQVYLKAAGERSYVTACPYDVATSWNTKWGQQPPPDMELPTQGGSNLNAWAGVHYDPTLRTVVTVGVNGKGAWTRLADPFVLGANLVPNPDTPVDTSGWLPFFATGATVWDAGNGGQVKFTGNGTGAQAGATYFALPANPAGLAFFARLSVAKNTTARACHIQIDWYSTTSFAGFLASTSGGTMTERSDGSLMTLAVSGIAPVGAVFARLSIVWTGVANGEVHFLKSARFHALPVADAGTFQIDISTLTAGQIGGTEHTFTSVASLASDHRLWVPIHTENPVTNGTTNPLQWLASVDLAALVL